MNISSIGVQQILPQTGVGGQNNPPPNQGSTEDTPAAAPDRAAAAPGTGQAVDKLV